MQILFKGAMPDKTKIQIEDWSEDFPSLHQKNDVVAAYPVAKAAASRKVFQGINGLPCVWEYPRKYDSFRLCLQFPCASDAESAYNNLLNGTAQLLDYKDYIQEKKYIECL